MERIGADYSRETDERVEFEFGDSGKMLGQVSLRPDGDLFLPADDSYIRLAEAKGLIAEVTPLCSMRAVILTRPDNPFRVTGLDDLLKPGLKVSLANPDRAAIGSVVREHLSRQRKWEALAAKIDVQHMNVTEAANAVHLGGRDATIVWDAVAANYPELVAIRASELEGAISRVAIARLSASPNVEAARRFVRYVTACDRGHNRFRESGFREVEPGQPWAERKSP